MVLIADKSLLFQGSQETPPVVRIVKAEAEEVRSGKDRKIVVRVFRDNGERQCL